MGKSQETLNKKEKEKKRLKKRKDKEEKKEERKANSDKGKSLEELFVYVDHNGNITSTPPDPMKKRIVNAEDMKISVSKQEEVEYETIRKGTVTFFNESKGFGFIKDSQTSESIFVHINSVVDAIKENSKVIFEVEMGKKGPTAVKVKIDR